MTEVFGGHLVKSVSIDNMINQRESVLDRFERAIEMLREAAKLAGAAHIGFPRIKFDEHRYQVYNMLDESERADVAGKLRKAIDCEAWRYLMSESGMYSLMDHKARSEWDTSIHEGKFPDFTRENVTATFSGLHAGRSDMFDRGVINVFKSLSWNYKTNKPFAFGKRIVLRGITAKCTGPSDTLGWTNSRTCDEVDDLVRVFSVLDGKPEPDHRGGTYHLVGPATRQAPHIVEHEYYQCKLHRNGNGHLLFRRPDLVAKMNAILTKHFPGALAYDKHAN